MKRFDRVFALACIGAMTLVSLATAQAQDGKKINVLLSNERTTGLHAAFSARELGFYEDEGIEVNLLSSDTTIPYVAFLSNGDADLVMLDPGQVFQAINADQPISVIYEAHQYAPEGIAVKAGSSIRGVADLKGKTIGLASDRDELTTTIALRSVGLSKDDVRTVVVGDAGPTMAKAFLDGTIDAFAGATNDLAVIEANGVAIRNITPAVISETPGNSFVILDDRKEELRDVTTRFLRAWSKAMQAGVLDTKTVAAICRKNVPEQYENLDVGLRLLDIAVYKTTLQRTRERGELRPDVWQRVQAPYIELGEFSAEMDPAGFLDSSFIEGANDYETAEVTEALAEWREANPDILLP